MEPLLKEEEEEEKEQEENGSGKKPESPTNQVYCLAILSQFIILSHGFEETASSTSILLLQDLGYMHLTTLWKELLLSGPLLTAAFTSLLAAWFCDKFGRKKSIMLSCFCFILGSIVAGSAYSREILLIGRLITGIALGFQTSAVYVAECSPANSRGCLLGFGQPLSGVGAVVSALISVAVSDNKENGWRFLWGSQAVINVVSIIGMLFLPESPRWYVMQSRREEAKESLIRLRNDEDVAEELREIEESFSEIEAMHKKSGGGNLVLRMFHSPSVRRGMMITIGMHFFARMAGEAAIVFYTGIILQMSGVGDVTTIMLDAALINCIVLVFAIIGAWLMDRVGRRPLAIIGLLGLFFSQLWLGTTFLMISKYSPVVNHTEDTLNSTCSIYSKCNDCIRDADCGFCHKNIDDVISGTCLPVSDSSRLMSNVGACNSSSTFLKDNMKFKHNYCPVSFSWLAVIGVLLYLICHALSMGHLAWIINVEILPLWARSTGFGIGTMLSRVLAFILVSTFLSFVEAIHDYGAFYVMSFIALLGSIFCCCFLPETKNKTLEEIESLLSGSKLRI